MTDDTTAADLTKLAELYSRNGLTPTDGDLSLAIATWAAGIDPHYLSVGLTVEVASPVDRLAMNQKNDAVPAECGFQIAVSVPAGVTVSGPRLTEAVVKKFARLWLRAHHPAAERATVGVQLADGEQLLMFLMRYGGDWLSPPPAE